MTSPAEKTQVLPEWEMRLSHAISLLSDTRTRLMSPGLLATAGDRLNAAVAVAEALELLTPTTKDDSGSVPPSFLTSLVRSSRDETSLEGAPATWTEIADSLGLSSPQRAFDLHSAAGPQRRAQARLAAAAARERMIPIERRPLPGISSAEAEARFGVSRTRIKSMSSAKEQLLHSYPVIDPNTGKPQLLLRAGKMTQIHRYYLHGKSLSEAAVELGVSESEVMAKAERGEIGRSRVLDPVTHEPVVDAKSGEPVWQFWPEHGPVESE